jgi:hypothetical protein
MFSDRLLGLGQAESFSLLVVPDTFAVKKRGKRFHHEHSRTHTNGREEFTTELHGVNTEFHGEKKGKGRVSGSIRKPRRGCGCVPDTSSALTKSAHRLSKLSGEL